MPIKVGKPKMKVKPNPFLRKVASNYIIEDNKGNVVSKPNTLAGARTAMDKLDTKYGGYVHKIYDYRTGERVR